MALPPLYICFLWHMHQPYYRDPFTHRYSMPWVRFHALKAYYDMPALLDGFRSIRQTFNLVPSLLLQLEEYASGQAKDDFLDVSLKPAGELSPEDKEFLLANFFNCNCENMIRPHPRYWELLLKRGMNVSESQLREAVARFNTQDFLDLQIWLNLAWFGYTSQDKTSIRALLQKGRFFTESDKTVLFDVQREVIKGLIPLYKRLAEKGQIEISTSPFYHPILPLLFDSDFARRARTDVSLPSRFSYPEDTKWHLREALRFHEKTFGIRPVGLWPSEGSVCPEMIPICRELGIEWAASDEAVLFNSARDDQSRNALFYPFGVDHDGARINMIFRDHALSDLFGFVYYRNEPHHSAADFFYHLQNIRSQWESGDPLLLNIILDGENAWEHYSDGGKAFLSGIYERLSKSSDFKTTTVSDYLREFPPKRSISNLYTGSWINRNFDIWIGGVEENTAWDCLKETRLFLSKRVRDKKESEKNRIEEAYNALYAAEGSDWFWWYGDQFSNAYAFEFDRLFRQHLSQVYQALGSEVPERITLPIKQTRKAVPLREPSGFIHPVLDGRQTQFFEWSGAGYFEDKALGGAMYHGKNAISGIWYGFDLENLYLRLDIREQDLLKWPLGKEICVVLQGTQPSFLVFVPTVAAKDSKYRFYEGRPDHCKALGEFDSIRSSKLVELAVPFKQLHSKAGEEIRFTVEIKTRGLTEERHPSTGYLSIAVPDENFERVRWQV
ncbi:MAG: glycoside hydrolase family 57 protein [Pseudomonadota bacterium]